MTSVVCDPDPPAIDGDGVDEALEWFDRTPGHPLAGDRPAMVPGTRVAWARAALVQLRPYVFRMLQAFLDPDDDEDEGDLVAALSEPLLDGMRWMVAGPVVDLSARVLTSSELALPQPSGERARVVPMANVRELASAWDLDLAMLLRWLVTKDAVVANLLARPFVVQIVDKALDRYWDGFEFDMDIMRATVLLDPTARTLQDGVVIPDLDAAAGAMFNERQADAARTMAAIRALALATGHRVATDLVGTPQVGEAVSRHVRDTPQRLCWAFQLVYGTPIDTVLIDQAAAFVDHVVDEGGEPGLTHVWASAETLPIP